MAGPTDPQGPGTEPDDLPEDDEDDLDIDGEDTEPEPVEAEEAEPPPEPPRSRGNQAIRQLRARAQQAEVERDFFRQQAQTRPAPQIDQQQLQQQRAQEYDRISMLPPNEQVAALHGMMQRENALTQLQFFDMNDRREFGELKASFPAAERLSGQVEQILQAQRAQGIYQFSRSQIFDALYGNEVRTRGTRDTGARRRDGAARVARQTVRPTGGRRGDVGGGGRRGGTQEQQDVALLRGVRIDEV
jgi:hypothetical protein